MKARDKEHRYGKAYHGERIYDNVWEYFHSIGQEVPDYITKMCDLSAYDAGYYENWYREKYASLGYRVLNIAKTGENISSLGGTGKWTVEAIVEIASKYNNSTDFKTYDKKAYNAARNRGMIKELFSNKVA